MPRNIKFHLSGYGEIEIDPTEGVVGLTIPNDDNESPVEIQFWSDEWEEFVETVELARVQNEPTVNTVHVVPVDPIPVAEINDLEGLVESYIYATAPFRIEYVKEDGERIYRTVSPYEVEEIKDGYPFFPPKYVRGWDHNREDIRTFRLTRIKAIGPAAAEYVQPDTV